MKHLLLLDFFIFIFYLFIHLFIFGISLSLTLNFVLCVHVCMREKRMCDVISRHVNLVMRKPNFCVCENKGADQLCSNLSS